MLLLLTTIADDFYINILRHHHIEVGKYIVRTVHPPTASERLKMHKKWVDGANGLPPKRSHPRLIFFGPTPNGLPRNQNKGKKSPKKQNKKPSMGIELIDC